MYTFQDRTCNTCAGSERYGRVLGDADSKARKAAENAPAASPLPSDGRKTYIRQLSDAEVAEVRAKRDV